MSEERDEITIGCRRTDIPPWNTPVDSPRLYWAYMMEDQCDGYGSTAAEAIGNLVMQIAHLYRDFDPKQPMPYIKEVMWDKEDEDKRIIERNQALWKSQQKT